MDYGFSGYFCSQILMLLALEWRGEENQPLVRAMGGLNGGLGFTQSVCGALTASCAVFGLFCGKGSDGEQPGEELNDMIREFAEWFSKEHGATECAHLRKENMGLCHSLVMACHIKTFEVLSEYGIVE